MFKRLTHNPLVKGFCESLGRGSDMPISWQAAAYRRRDVRRYYAGVGMGNRVATGVIAQTIPETFLGKIFAFVTGRKSVGKAGDMAYDWIV
jgi:hypothetical protein